MGKDGVAKPPLRFAKGTRAKHAGDARKSPQRHRQRPTAPTPPRASPARIAALARAPFVLRTFPPRSGGNPAFPVIPNFLAASDLRLDQIPQEFKCQERYKTKEGHKPGNGEKHGELAN